MKKKFYITTAIPYVNAQPHIGHALEFIQADVVARYHKLSGEEVCLLSGADENSLKNVQAAEQEGITTQALCDKNSQLFQDLAKALKVSFDIFQRSTEEKHFESSQKLWELCAKSGDIYKKSYSGLYCVGCEIFYSEDELEAGLCPEHKTKPERVSEENYFFRLSKYQSQIEKLLTSDKLKIIPQTRKNEALSFIKQGLGDFSISRSKHRAKGWGVPVPDDSEQIMYVWFDALNIYQTGVGFGWKETLYRKWWPADLHIIGKGILRFHAVYWPAILLSAGLPLPKSIFIHGYITIGGQKISKTLGNVIDPFELVKKYGTDAVRYFLLREIPPTEDGDFTYEKFEQRYNADLAKGLGNLVARIITLAEIAKLENKELQRTFFIESEIITNNRRRLQEALNDFKFNEALAVIWTLIGWCDHYIEVEKVWENPKRNLNKIHNLLFVLFNIARLLQPFLPGTSDEIFKQLGFKPTDKKWKLNIKKSKPLFPRI